MGPLIKFKLAAFIGLGLSVTSLVFAQNSSAPPTLTPTQIAAAQQQAQEIASGLQQSPEINSAGTVTRNADGSITTAPTDASSLNSESSLMQTITGSNGFKATGNPGGSGQVFGGNTQEQGYTDISCFTAPGATRSVGGVLIEFYGCKRSNNSISGVNLSVCTDSGSGGYCTPTQMAAYQAFPAGQYTTVNNVQVGIGCNSSTNTCRVTVNNSFSLSAPAAQLKAQANEQQQKAGAPAVQSSLQAMTQSTNYQAATAQNASTVQCYESNQNSFNSTGTVSTCDGKQTADVGNNTSTASCTPNEVCETPTTSTQTWTTTCTKTFPITTLSCTQTTPSLDCTETQTTATGATTSSCTASQISGGTLVGKENQQCLQYGTAQNGQAPPCLEQQWTAVYVFKNQAKTTNCLQTPLPIAGNDPALSCDENVSDAQIICAQNGWVGRTLPTQSCEVSTVSASGTSMYSQLDYQEKAGCGYCATANVAYSCQGAPSASQGGDTCSTSQLAGCTLTGTTPQSSAYGLITSEQETYSCSKQTTGCSQWKDTNNCPLVSSAYSMPTSEYSTAGNGNSLNQVVADVGVADAVTKSGNSNITNSAVTPKVFNGQDLRCTKPLGFVNGVISPDCCQIGLTGASGTTCSQNELKLAAARRAHFAVYIGTYCSKETNYVFFTRCDQQTQTYCVFDGLLPKLVQVQGREQLQQIATSGAGASLQTQTLSFPYYSGNGGWTAPITINGIQFAAYEEPAYCESAQATAAEFAQNPSAQACPAALETWIASCEITTGCGQLPVTPQSGSGTWVINDANPLALMSIATSPHSVAKGACDTKTDQCAYQISAWPLGSGSRAMVSRQVSLQAYAAAGNSSVASTVEIGNTVIQINPEQVSAGTSTVSQLPPSLSTSVSTNSGSSWSAFTLPTQINSNVTVPGTDITVTGGCIASTGMCTYQFTGSIQITAKPWGSPQNPDCSGFTLDQFTALDMGKMDLSQWVASVTGQMTTTSSTMVSQAQSEAATGPQNTTINSEAPQGVILTPVEGLGPFAVTLAVDGNWPENYSDPALNKDPVFGVDVNWGDCSGPSTATPVPSGGFAAQHLYPAPNTPGICDENGPVTTPHNLVHNVVVTVHSLSGTHTVTLSVKNDWTNYTSGS